MRCCPCSYITTPPMFTTAAVCEEYVSVAAGAKSAQADHGPERLVAVQYILSFGASEFSVHFYHPTSLT